MTIGELNETDNEFPILVGKINGLNWIRIIEKGWHQNCIGFREYILKLLNEGEKHFVLDFGLCKMVDSTFAGTVADVAFRAKHKKLEVSITLKNLSSRILHLFESLGIDRLVRVDSSSDYFEKENSIISSQNKNLEKLSKDIKDKAELTKQMITAHEALCKADSKNEMKFQNVLKYLKEEEHGND